MRFISIQAYLIVTIMFRPCGFLAAENFIIFWVSNLLTVRIPDVGYFRKKKKKPNVPTILDINILTAYISVVSDFFFKWQNILNIGLLEMAD